MNWINKSGISTLVSDPTDIEKSGWRLGLSVGYLHSLFLITDGLNDYLTPLVHLENLPSRYRVLLRDKDIDLQSITIIESLNTKWITDGTNDFRIYNFEAVPDGYRRGRSNRGSGYAWITDGVTERFIADLDDKPFGWRFGRLPRY